MALLQITNLSQTLGKKQILSSINLAADGGAMVVLLGPNGAGKTTLLKSIMGLNPTPAPNQERTSSSIVFDNQIINTWSVAKRVQAGLLYLPQHCSLFGQLSVLDNIMLVYQYHEGWKKESLRTFQEEADRWLLAMHLLQTKMQKVNTLSGGQKRKLEVIRSLLMKPRLLMLDEPFAGVDPKSIYELKTIFTDLAHRGIGVIISDHHVDQLLSIAQTVYVLIAGHVVTCGAIKDVLENDYTKENYLGTQFYQEMAQRFLQEKGTQWTSK